MHKPIEHSLNHHGNTFTADIHGLQEAIYSLFLLLLKVGDLHDKNQNTPDV